MNLERARAVREKRLAASKASPLAAMLMEERRLKKLIRRLQYRETLDLQKRKTQRRPRKDIGQRAQNRIKAELELKALLATKDARS